MVWNRCPRCNDLVYGTRQCQCEPFEIIDQDGDEHTVYAFDEWNAALAWAKDSNEGNDYYLMEQSVDITVNGTVFCVSAEPDIHYSANKKEKSNG